MNALTFDAVERAVLCDLLVELGPTAPTLLDPWTTKDLAAHLVLREHDHRAAPGLVIPGTWGRLAERHRMKLVRTVEYVTLVTIIRKGPPRGFFRMGWVRRVPNLNEFFVHHEDVRRANGFGPRTNTHAFDEALWRNLEFVPWLLARRLHGVGLELEWRGSKQLLQARRGQPTVRLTVMPGELLLYLFGRQATADVDISGPTGAVETVTRTRFGI